MLNLSNVERRKQVEESRKDAERDGVKVPMTISEYCVRSTSSQVQENSGSEEHNITCPLTELDDFYYDDEDDEYDDDDDDYGYYDDSSSTKETTTSSS